MRQRVQSTDLTMSTMPDPTMTTSSRPVASTTPGTRDTLPASPVMSATLVRAALGLGAPAPNAARAGRSVSVTASARNRPSAVSSPNWRITAKSEMARLPNPTMVVIVVRTRGTRMSP